MTIVAGVAAAAPATYLPGSVHQVVTERDTGVAVVRAAGELDAFVAPDLDAAFSQVSGEVRVLADLSSVSFMDSTALGALVRGTRELGEAGAAVRVVLPAGSARRIFEITALDQVLPVAESRDEGIRDLGRG